MKKLYPGVLRLHRVSLVLFFGGVFDGFFKILTYNQSQGVHSFQPGSPFGLGGIKESL
jgi:hypothetical protein